MTHSQHRGWGVQRGGPISLTIKLSDSFKAAAIEIPPNTPQPLSNGRYQCKL